MQNRQQLSAILNQLLLDINQYVTKVNHELVSSKPEDAEKSAGLRAVIKDHNKKKYAEVKNDDLDVYVVVYNAGPRNHELLAKRLSNLLSVKEDLLDKLQTLKDERVDAINLEYVNTAVSEIKVKLQTAIEANDSLNKEYNKDHQSYLQGKQAQQGSWAAYFNKTAHQSRANTALEKAMGDLDHFSQKINPQPRHGFCK